MGYKKRDGNNCLSLEMFETKDYLDNALIEAASPVIKKTDSYIKMITLAPVELIPFLLEFYEHYDKKLKENDKSTRWQNFGRNLRKFIA